MSLLLGTAPNQVPTNGDLGSMAFEDVNAVNIGGGSITGTLLGTDATAYQLVANSYPSTPPSLMLDFANSKTLDPRITFTRASTATYYDGVTNAVAEQNLFTYSEQFDNAAWSKTSSTVTANSIVAPDGTTTADTLTASSTAATVCVIQGIQNVVGQTVSVYAKAGTSSFLGVQVYNSASWANFNLSTGAVASSSGCTASVVSVGNSWYRCIVANTTNGALNVVIAGKDADPGVAPYNNGNMTSGNTIYLWGAQVEIRAAVTAYTPTTTAAITNYIPVLQTAASGVARLDYNPTTGESLGLLIEESRTNLATYSTDFSQAVWTKLNSTVTANVTVAPDSTLTASLLLPNLGSSPGGEISRTGTNGIFSIYVKRQNARYCGFTTYGYFGGNVYFDLDTGTVVSGYSFNANFGTVTPAIVSAGNGWYRISITATTDSSRLFRLFPSATATNGNPPTGDGTSGIYIWGAQLEAGAFATSYIPTVASQVTRAADAASMTGTNFSSWYNVGQGSFYGEANLYGGVNGLYNYIAYATDGTTANNIRLGFYNNGTSNYGGLGISVTSVAQTIFVTAGLSANTFAKLAGSYAPNNFAISKDGATAVTSSSGGIPAVSSLYIGQRVGNAEYIDGHIKRIAYYPVALTSTQLVTLTT